MTSVPDAVRPRVAQLIRMFASTHDGEALGAVRAIGRTLKASGASFHDLAEQIERGPERVVIYLDRQEQRCPNVPPCWGNSGALIVRMKLERAVQAGGLTTWEADFAASIASQIAASRSWRPTPKQEQRLDALMAKLHAAGRWE